MLTLAFYYVIFTLVVSGGMRVIGLPDPVMYGYWIIATVGLVMWVRDQRAKGRQALVAEVRASSARMMARLDEKAREADLAQQEPWYADRAVDPKTAMERALNDGYHAFDGGLLVTGDPFLLLPLDALVKWGFASREQVDEARTLANSPNVPEPWQNPLMLRELAYLGWTGPEALARVGLLLERIDALELKAERTASAMRGIEAWLPPHSRTPLRAFAVLVKLVLELDEAGLQMIRDERDRWELGTHIRTMSLVSDAALRVGYTVRWARWENPTDETENMQWRMNMDAAASAVEWAAAALAEPALSDQQVEDLYAPLEVAIPRQSLG